MLPLLREYEGGSEMVGDGIHSPRVSRSLAVLENCAVSSLLATPLSGEAILAAARSPSLFHSQPTPAARPSNAGREIVGVYYTRQLMHCTTRRLFAPSASLLPTIADRPTHESSTSRAYQTGFSSRSIRLTSLLWRFAKIYHRSFV